MDDLEGCVALLHQAFTELYDRGKHRVGLGVDAESITGATKLYEKVGMRSDPVREVTIFEKEIRPGVDLTTQVLET
jgi:hypothetical protein